jgi:hypothetical protein
MNALKAGFMAAVSVGLIGTLQVAVAKDVLPSIGQNTLKGFGGPHLSGGQMDAVGVTPRVNLVYFRWSGQSDADYPVASVTIDSFVLDEESVTYGQRFGGAGVLTDTSVSDNSTLYVMAGRKNDKTNVDWLKNIKGYPLADNPKELHFAVIGDLTLNVTALPGYYSGKLTCKRIALAQGHDSLGNNWWMFSNYTLEPTPINKGGITARFDRKLQTPCESSENKQFFVEWTPDVEDKFVINGIHGETWPGFAKNPPHLSLSSGF